MFSFIHKNQHLLKVFIEIYPQIIDIIITHYNIIIKSTTIIIKQEEYIQFIKENELVTKNNYISFIVSICGLQDSFFYNSTLNKTLQKTKQYQL